MITKKRNYTILKYLKHIKTYQCSGVIDNFYLVDNTEIRTYHQLK